MSPTIPKTMKALQLVEVGQQIVTLVVCSEAKLT
jgi:hypothetical protein